MAELGPADIAMIKDKETYATLVTINDDGTPQASITWIDVANGELLLNTVEGRRKARNLQRDPRAAILVQADPYRWFTVNGTVVGTIPEPRALEHIDELSRRYDGEPWVPVKGQVRVIFRLRPDSISHYV